MGDGSQSKTSPWKIVNFSSVTQWGEQAKYAPLSEKRDGNPASALPPSSSLCLQRGNQKLNSCDVVVFVDIQQTDERDPSIV